MHSAEKKVKNYVSSLLTKIRLSNRRQLAAHTARERSYPVTEA